jgi:diguanylate cyclase (GGDEF)-like protein/PAS domain S-box-containing protein
MVAQEVTTTDLGALAPDGIVVLDADARLVGANAAAAALVGLAPGEAVGASALGLVHPDDVWHAADAVRRSIASPGTPRAPITLRLRRGDDSYFPCEMVGVFRPGVGVVASLRDVSGRHDLAATIDHSERRFHIAARYASEILVLLDERGVIRYVSPATLAASGWRPEELIGTTGQQIIHPDDVDRVVEAATPVFAQPWAEAVVEYRRQRRDGEWRDCEARFVNLLRHEHIGRVVMYVRDVTDRKQAEAERHALEQRFVSAFENAPTGMALHDLAGRFLQVNRALCDLLGFSRRALLATTVGALVHPDDATAEEAQRAALAAGRTERYRLELRFVRSDGRVVWGAVNVSALPDADGAGRYVIAHVEDVTRARRDQERLTRQATHDALTGLPNRASLLEQLDAAVARAAAGGPVVAVLFCDLDRFKVVNDSDGHDVGDRLLVECGRRLRSVVGDDDVVARFGGDEFVVLCAVGGRDEATTVADRVASALDAPVELGGREYAVSTSIGIAFSDQAGDARDLLRLADAAMYRAKARGRARYAVFEPAMREELDRRAQTERALRHALKTGRLRVHYQPLVALAGHQLVGAEALVRWEDPDRGLVGPAEFVPVAEDCGLIVPIGRWVLDDVLGRLAAWELARALPRDFGVAVNLSLRQLAGGDLPTEVAGALARHHVAPTRLWFEVTESALADDAVDAGEVLLALRALGVRLAIDDFGTGYSALTQLKLFPFDRLKIDRSFVGRVVDDAEDQAIVDAIVGIAGAFGLEVVAEGVETPEQERAVVARGVALGQGYRFGPPVDADTFAARWLARAGVAPVRC